MLLPLPTVPSPTLLAPNSPWPPRAQALSLNSEGHIPLCLSILAEPEEGYAPLWGACDFSLAAFRFSLMPDILKGGCVCVGSYLVLICLCSCPFSPPSLYLLLLEPHAPSFLTQHLCLKILSVGSFRAHLLCPSYLPLLEGPLNLSLST